jgi:hypothetical protein
VALLTKAKSFLQGAMAVTIVLAPFTWWERIATPIPYYDVKIVETHHDPVWFYVTATFKKNSACKLDDFAVVGEKLGLTQFLPYEDADGLPSKYDRPPGLQTLRIRVIFGQSETIEIKTRHVCGGEKVDKTFAKFTVAP